jgi:hypothetical protein
LADSFGSASVIRAIEAEHPEVTDFFKQEREWYAESKDGKGPMLVQTLSSMERMPAAAVPCVTRLPFTKFI